MAEQVDVDRGARMKGIRDEREESQADFAERLNEKAASLGFAVRYTFSDVSRRETARKALDAEDFATVALLDPQKRGWIYVAFGQSVTVGRDAWELLAGQKKRTG